VIAAPILSIRGFHIGPATLACFIVVDMRSAYDEARIGALLHLGAKSRTCCWCSRSVLVDADDRCSHMATTIASVSMDDINFADEEGFDAGWPASNGPVTMTSRYCSPECLEWDNDEHARRMLA